MIDINAVLSQALKAAVDEAVSPLVKRIDELETKLTEASLFQQTTNVTIPLDEDRMVKALDSQEWFWDKVNRYVDGQIEEAIDEHCTNYDHDEYDVVYNEWGCESTAEFVRDENLQEAISEKITKAVRELDITVSIR